MRSWPVRAGSYLVAGALAGFVAWWLGPRLALAGAIGSAVVLGLVARDRIRVHQRQLRSEVRQLRKAAATDKRVGALEKRLRAAQRKDFAQLEALHNLHSMLPATRRMPGSRLRWAAAPDLLLLLVSLVQEHRPATIVDLGSGASTVWMALALREFDVDGKVISVDHDVVYADRTRQKLLAIGLEPFAEVRHAPLVELELDGDKYSWYEREALADIKSCDLLNVDGPPGRLRRGARYPALPVFSTRMEGSAHVVVDDYARPAERDLVARWVERFPGWTLHELPLERGAAHLVRAGG